MATLKGELIDLSDHVWSRTRDRLDGLTDEEYLWEPAPGCWNLRRRVDGSWAADSVFPPPDPAPFTTIASRLWHVIDLYGEDRAPQWLDVPAQGAPLGLDDPDGIPPASATDALAMLDRAHDRWNAHLHLVTEDQLAERIGPVAGPQYAERTRAAYVLHMLDEHVHHGAELALLRDLYRWRKPLDDDPLVERAIRGDLGLLDELDELGDRAPTSGLVDHAAGYGRWDLVIGLVRKGAPVSTTGRTPLHLAAAAGEIGVVDVLLAHGGDPQATDPDFHATPAQWAEFFHRQAMVEHLARRSD